MAFQSAFRAHFLIPLHTYIISPILTQLSTSPDLATIAILVIILFISLKILNMLYRTIVFWVSLVTRLMFWTLILGFSLWIWQRGLQGAMTDASAWGETWSKNYDRFQQQELNARIANGAGAAGMGGTWWPGR